MHGESADWTLEAHLMASMVDSLRWLQWAKTKDAEKGKNAPEPVPRPGVEDTKKKQRTGEGMDIDAAYEWLGWK